MSDAMRYAGFWRRAGAHLIDNLIYAPLAIVILRAIYGADYLAPEEPVVVGNLADALGALLPRFHGFWDFMLQVGVPLILVIVLWRRFGATPGKKLLHCRVVDATSGGPLGWGQSALRSIAYLASMLPLGLGFLWIAWDRRRQGFHDKVAGTVVIYAPENEEAKSIEQLIKEGR